MEPIIPQKDNSNLLADSEGACVNGKISEKLYHNSNRSQNFNEASTDFPEQQSLGTSIELNGLRDDKQRIQLLCDTMKKQIISRAFYGWLAYCRHLKTVRTHLADLVNSVIVPINSPSDVSGGITSELWKQMHNERGQIIIEPLEFYRMIYYGGIEHSIRAQVWLYLLEHYHFEDDYQVKMQHDTEMRQKYEMIMSDWLAVEAIVRQRDKEILASNLAKFSSESNNSTIEMVSEVKPTLQSVKSVSNEVFDDDISFSDSRKSSIQSVRMENETNNENENTANLETKVHSDKLNSKGKLTRHRQVESVASLYGQGNENMQNILITNPSIDKNPTSSMELPSNGDSSRLPVSSTESGGSQCVSPASSNGGIYSVTKLNP